MRGSIIARTSRVVLNALAVLLIGCPAFAQGIANPIPDPIQPSSVSIGLELVAEGFGSAVGVVPMPGRENTLVVVDQAGLLRVIDGGRLVEQPMLDLREQLVALNRGFDERGLLGLAFHPGFTDPASPGYRRLYTYSSQPVAGVADFTVPMPGGVSFNHQAVIREWRVSSGDGLAVDVSTSRDVMRIDQPQFNHDGGEIAFGPDGFLYISLGDGGNANDFGPGHSPGGNGQDLTNVLGKMLRIDPLGLSGARSANGQYSIPADNPFVDDASALDEIWAFGLRNSWRFSFDGETGRLVAADVGQENIEEVNVIEKGGNYGWPIREGEFFFVQEGQRGRNITRRPTVTNAPATKGPAVVYDHDEGISITGGFVYRGSAIAGLRGMYVFGDWKASANAQAGRLFHADLESGKLWELKPAGGVPGFVSAFGRDGSGELYLCTNVAGGPLDGEGSKVWKIVGGE